MVRLISSSSIDESSETSSESELSSVTVISASTFGLFSTPSWASLRLRTRCNIFFNNISTLRNNRTKLYLQSLGCSEMPPQHPQHLTVVYVGIRMVHSFGDPAAVVLAHRLCQARHRRLLFIGRNPYFNITV